MKVWAHRFSVGLAVAVTAGGIAAASNLLISTSNTVERTSAAVEDMDRDLDNFMHIRYQQDLEASDRRFARLEDRLNDSAP